MAASGRVVGGSERIPSQQSLSDQKPRLSVDTLAQKLAKFRLEYPQQSKGIRLPPVVQKKGGQGKTLPRPISLQPRYRDDRVTPDRLATEVVKGGRALVREPSLQIRKMPLIPKEGKPLSERLTPFEAEFVTPQGGSALYSTTSKSTSSLGAKWRWCPSDHLPVGLQIEGMNICSWNVLSSQLIQEWVVEKNIQGLNGSMLTTLHTLIQEDGVVVSQRELEVVRLLLSMLQHSSHPKAAIALQECEPLFLQYLLKRLPGHIKLIYKEQERGCAMLYDTRVLKLEKVSWPNVFSNRPDRTSMNVLFRKVEDKKLLRLLNVHIPGDPTGPFKREWMSYVDQIRWEPMVVCGDMNFETEEMKASFQVRGKFDFHAPYRTNVGPDFSKETPSLCAKAIDYFMTYKVGRAQELLPEQMFEGRDREVIVNTLALFEQKKVRFQ